MARPGQVLAILSLAAFLGSLDLFIVNVAFEELAKDFDGESLSELSWVLNAYAIVFAALLIPFGRLADRQGRKRWFLGGVGLFTAASVACAAAPSLWPLVGFRILQAVGAAALTPASLGLLIASTPEERRATAVRIWAATGALAAAAGPVVGGLLVEANWRWAFVINLPFGVFAIVAAWRIVSESRDSSATRLPDVLGAGVLALAVGALALGLVQGPEWGWTSAGVLAGFSGGVVLLAGSWWRAHHHPLPVLEPAMLKIRTFGWANVTAIAFGAAFAANLLAGVLWMQSVWNWSPLHSGLGFALGPLLVLPASIVANRLSPRLGSRTVTSVGCLLFAAGSVWTATQLRVDATWAGVILPGLIVAGTGVGFALPELVSAASGALPPKDGATASAVIYVARQLGSVLGVGVLIAVLGSPVTPAAAESAFRDGFWVCAVAAGLGAITALGMSSRPSPAGSDAPVAAHL